MKLKATNKEMLALLELVMEAARKYNKVVFETNSEEDRMEPRLYQAIFQEMMLAFQKSVLMAQAKYSIKLKPSWMCAFHLEFSGLVDVTTFEGNLAQQVCNKIHQFLINKNMLYETDSNHCISNHISIHSPRVLHIPER